MNPKTPDKDLLEVLERLEEDIEVFRAVNGGDDDGIQAARKTETVIRRLAREAGYQL
jgi:hypothetical protein